MQCASSVTLVWAGASQRCDPELNNASAHWSSVSRGQASQACTHTHMLVHLYTVCALWCVYSEVNIALREKQATVSFLHQRLMSDRWDFKRGSDSHHFVHQHPIRHTGRHPPQRAGRDAVFKSDCRILIIAIGNICSLSYFHYCSDSPLLIQLTAHPVILLGAAEILRNAGSSNT